MQDTQTGINSKRSLNAGKTNINYKTKLETGNKKLRKENKPETATLAIDESTAGSNPIQQDKGKQNEIHCMQDKIKQET